MISKDSNKNNARINPFAKMEEEVLNFWEKGKIFEKSIEKDAPQGDYVFYDGPPFATGLPHYGHIVGSIMKDVVPRYWTMNGYRVERKWGWDCHGLPIENIIEKEMGSQSKKDIEAMGVKKFNQSCRSKVMEFADDWKKYIKKLGRWVDMENSYKTMDLPYMESVWWVFKELWKKDLIYKGYRSMHICPRCETTLSQSEVSEGYKAIKDLSATAKFELVDSPSASSGQARTYVLAWTTTPWTLIGNVALAVGENIDYVKVNVLGEGFKANDKKPGESVKLDNKLHYFILAKDRIEEVLKDKEYEVVEEFKAKELIGKKYKPLFDYYSKQDNLENKENGWQIYAGDFVNTEEGTGIVHIAPAFGEDDMNLGKEYNLPFVQHVEMDGSIKKEAGEFAGKNVKPRDDHMATDVDIIKYLAHNNLLFHKEKYEHSYPHCWRCDTPLINYATSSWFVAITKIKDKLLETAKEINWSPEHIKEGRFGNWLEGARDWSISRQRFWASVIPIWECDCGEIKVIGSVEELEKLSGQKVNDLHKDVVDEITFECKKCGGTMKRVPDVLDCWFESSSMPYAQMHYPFENQERFENNFPAEFIAEGADQTRAWFYYLHAIANGIKDKHAFKNVIVNGIVLAEDGKKMSKKLQNYPDPMDVFQNYGADALRYYLLTSPVMLADTLNFSEKGVSEALRKVVMTLWNVVKFYGLFVDTSPPPATASRALRAGQPSSRTGEGEIKSDNILDKWIIARLNQIIQETTDAMDKYNLPKASRPIMSFIDDLSTWYIRRSRDRFKSDNVQDKKLAQETTRYVLVEFSKVIAPFIPFIAEQVWQSVTGNNFQNENKSVHLEEWPEAGKIDKKILEEMEQVRKVVEFGLAKRDEAGIKVRQPLNKLKVKSKKLKVDYVELIKDEVNIKEVEFDEDKGELSVELDVEITEELKLEGIKRELVRSINAMRKKEGLTLQDRVKIIWSSESDDIKKTIDKYKEDLKNDTLSDDIVEGKVNSEEVKINGDNIKLYIEN